MIGTSFVEISVRKCWMQTQKWGLVAQGTSPKSAIRNSGNETHQYASGWGRVGVRGIDCDTKDVFVMAYPDNKRNAATLIPVIITYIKPDKTIIGVFWKAYNNIGDSDYKHLIANHSTNTGVHFRHVFFLFARCLRGCCRLPQYLKRIK